jgi:hypothetical protein
MSAYEPAVSGALVAGDRGGPLIHSDDRCSLQTLPSGCGHRPIAGLGRKYLPNVHNSAGSYVVLLPGRTRTIDPKVDLYEAVQEAP